ncbi:MAG: DUF4845 domain-containing protein [Acidobacteriia bacterium]|nr:DUF4845 domain-containing protein [Terriglobia bacterium]
MMNLLPIFGGKPGRASARKSSSQRGGGRLKAVIWTVLLVTGAYTGFKVIPIYINEYQLQDKMQEVARFATVGHKTDDELREAVWQEIQDLGIPARKENIKIENTGRYAKISVDYTVPLDLIFYHGELHFSPSSENKSLT